MMLKTSECCIHSCPFHSFVPFFSIHAHQTGWARMGHQYEMINNRTITHSALNFIYSSKAYQRLSRTFACQVFLSAGAWL